MRPNGWPRSQKNLGANMNFVWFRKPNGWPDEPIYMLFEVQGATNVEAMSQCIYEILCGQWVTNVVARSQG